MKCPISVANDRNRDNSYTFLDTIHNFQTAQKTFLKFYFKKVLSLTLTNLVYTHQWPQSSDKGALKILNIALSPNVLTMLQQR